MREEEAEKGVGASRLDGPVAAEEEVSTRLEAVAQLERNRFK
jgi:hypothetical protein